MVGRPRMSSVMTKPFHQPVADEGVRRDLDRTVPERPIDLVHLARQSLGDRALETDLLSLFERQAGQIMSQIKGADAATDRKCLGDLAHTLKGSARAVGAVGVAAAARAYEDALAAGDARQAVDKLDAAVGHARAAIADLLTDR